MKTFITPNLVKFILSVIVLTIIFRVTLSASLADENIIAAVITAVLYATLMFFSGLFFGKKDYEYLPIFDIGFRFHLSTFLTFNGLSILWFIYGTPSKWEHIKTVYITALIWSFFLIIHFVFYLYYRKKSIKHLDKDDLFE